MLAYILGLTKRGNKGITNLGKLMDYNLGLEEF